MRRGNHKLIHFFEDDRWELYDLDADMSESRNLAAELPERTSELRAALEAWWMDTGAFLPTAQ
jgi:arylsulfatase A-like enzyme